MKTQKIDGTKIVGATPYYENIIVAVDQDGQIVHHYLTPVQLLVILNEFDFMSIKKRTRSWMQLDINEWRVEKYDEPRS